jgi:SAM-dependent methyltransferase
MNQHQRPDHFSRVSRHYAQARPTYPEPLFDWLAGLCPRRRLAVDVGAGTGQATVAMARRFERVIGTDLSAEQLRGAAAAANIEYRACPAERLDVPDACADLVTVAQSLHWFDLDRFWPEVRRVLRPAGVIAVWTYGLLQVDGPHADAIVQRFYREVVGPWWPPGREHVENGYASLSFPFKAGSAPAFDMSVTWDLAAFVRYVRSWSSTSAMIEKTGQDPVPALESQLAPLWGPARRVTWPLGIRVGTLG